MRTSWGTSKYNFSAEMIIRFVNTLLFYWCAIKIKQTFYTIFN